MKSDLTGMRFSMLTVIKKTNQRKKRQVVWLCRCHCGNFHYVASYSLTSKETQSCGCLKKNILGQSSITHGMTGTLTYKTWRQIIRRCSEKAHIQYSDYGGRGITVCKRWGKFENFLADMGERPTPKHSIDRINNNGNYEPGNCRWATKKQQQNNKSNNRILYFDGKSKTMTEWAEQVEMKVGTLYKRLSMGWGIEKALKEAVK